MSIPSILINTNGTLYVTGGNSLLPGFVNRVEYQLKQVGNNMTVIHVDHPMTSTFIGASKYGMLNHLRSKILTLEEYENNGLDFCTQQKGGL